MTPRASGWALGIAAAIGSAGGASEASGLRNWPQAASASAAARAAATATGAVLRCVLASPHRAAPGYPCHPAIQYVLSHPFDKGNEAHGAEVGVFEPVRGLLDADERLHRVRLADGEHHDPAVAELVEERLRRVLGGGGQDDAVEGGLLGQAERAVAVDDGDVVQAELLEELAGAAGEAAVALDGVDAAGEAGEDRRLVAGAGADLEHLRAAGDVEGLGHQADDGGLADRLAAGDGERRVLVGALLEDAFEEFAARGLLHGLQHLGVGHPARAEGEDELHLLFGREHGREPRANAAFPQAEG